MQTIFLIGDAESLAGSIERYFRFTRGLRVQRIITPHETTGRGWIPACYRHAVESIENGGNKRDDPQLLRNSIVFIALSDSLGGDIAALNPIAQESNWAILLAMLVLTFPEIHWVLCTPRTAVSSSLFERVHLLDADNPMAEILALHDKKMTTLFDATDLRNRIRQTIREQRDLDNNRIAPYLPLRKELAAAIDEEEAYAYFNAYVTYRFGFRSHAVASYGLMQDLFADSANSEDGVLPLLTLEDLYLNFADKAPGVHLSNLRNRTKLFGKLEKSAFRVFVTVGHRHDPQGWQDNRQFLHDLQQQRKQARLLHKPLSGIFDLWQKSGLHRWLRAEAGKASMFIWPPAKIGALEARTNHSAPGRLLDIADHLIRRAQRLLNSATSVPDAVHGAVLALEAQELLGNQTPTTALEALALKHQLEVTAECMFYGVEYNFDVKKRFKDIAADISSIGKWFHPEIREISELNAAISIINALLDRFKSYGQFDEEQECLKRIRKLHRHLWFKKHKSWAWLFYWMRWYVEFLLSSLPRFALAILFWVMVLSFSFTLVCHNQQTGDLGTLSGPAHAFTTFFGLQPPHELGTEGVTGNLEVGLSLLAIFLGFVHLGIFVSHLYSLIARK